MKKISRSLFRSMVSSLIGRTRAMYWLAEEDEKGLLDLKFSGYLKEHGWNNSWEKKIPLDAQGNPIPWLPYPLIDFLAERFNKSINVFEYGSGMSTLFHSARVKHVTAAESDHQWYSDLQKKVPSNVTLKYYDPNNMLGYEKASSEDGVKYDMIVVDGLNRVECARQAIGNLSERGVVLVDDSHWEELHEILKFYKKNDFRELHFWGHAPCINYIKRSTILYKSNNCLGI